MAPLALGLSSVLLVMSFSIVDLQQNVLARFRLQTIADAVVLAAAADLDVEPLLESFSLGSLEITGVKLDSPESQTHTATVCGRINKSSNSICASALARAG